jgi:NADH:ubiquinone oxidoreductase subunit 6 (subunit J)
MNNPLDGSDWAKNTTHAMTVVILKNITHPVMVLILKNISHAMMVAIHRRKKMAVHKQLVIATSSLVS